MKREERVGDAPAFVVPREKKDGNAVVRQASQRSERRIGKPCRNAAPVEEVASVEHDVHVPLASGFEGGLEALEELGSAPRARAARPRREVVTEMRVGEEEEAHGTFPRRTEQAYSAGPSL